MARSTSYCAFSGVFGIGLIVSAIALGGMQVYVSPLEFAIGKNGIIISVASTQILLILVGTFIFYVGMRCYKATEGDYNYNDRHRDTEVPERFSQIFIGYLRRIFSFRASPRTAISAIIVILVCAASAIYLYFRVFPWWTVFDGAVVQSYKICEAQESIKNRENPSFLKGALDQGTGVKNRTCRPDKNYKPYAVVLDPNLTSHKLRESELGKYYDSGIVIKYGTQPGKNAGFVVNKEINEAFGNVDIYGTALNPAIKSENPQMIDRYHLVPIYRMPQVNCNGISFTEFWLYGETFVDGSGRLDGCPVELYGYAINFDAISGHLK